MAKKVVASLRDKSGVKYSKLIKSVKSDKKRSITTDILKTYMNRDNWRKQ